MSDQSLVDREDCVLVVIDVQEKLMPVISGKERVIANTATLVRFCGICGIPVVFTEQKKLGPTVPEIKDLMRGFTAVEKLHFNCFLNDEFRDRVERLGRKTLIIAGAEAHICVAQTAIGAPPGLGAHRDLGHREDRRRCPLTCFPSSISSTRQA